MRAQPFITPCAKERTKRKSQPDHAKKQEQKRIDEYNKALKKTRETELPPLYEPLALNCELMFALAKNTTGMPDMTFVSVEDGSKIAAGSLVGDKKMKIVMVVGEQNVQVQGKLVYVSENVTVTGEDTAITAKNGYSYLVFK